MIWDKVFKNGQVKFVEDNLLNNNWKTTNFTWSILKNFELFEKLFSKSRLFMIYQTTKIEKQS